MNRVFATLLLTAPAAFASEFGKKGQVLPSGGVSYVYSSAGDVSQSRLLVEPEVRYFVLDHLALGGGLLYQIDNVSVAGVDRPSVTNAGLDVIGSYDVPLDRWFSLFVSAALYGIQRGGTDVAWGASTFAPVLFHPVNHFFLGLGPSFALDLLASGSAPKATAFGLHSLIGGYF
jgi:hypothetical protein